MSSDAERSLVTQLAWAGVPTPVTEHRFRSDRRWRFDLAWPDRHLALEAEGGSWVGGRHSQGTGFERDCEKHTEAAIDGWRLLRVTPAMIEDGRALGYVERALR